MNPQRGSLRPQKGDAVSKFFPTAERPKNERTEVTLRWAEWQAKNGTHLSKRIGVFRKGQFELVVYEYGGVCGVLKRKPRKPPRNPELVEFRPWSEPFDAVASKLAGRGWKIQQVDTLEAGHAN